MNESLFFYNKKCTQKYCMILVQFFWANGSFFLAKEQMSNSLICSFIISDLSKSLMVTHLSWATWAIRSWSLFWHEQPERFAHSPSYVLSDLRESLTLAHLIWAIWASEQMSDEGMSEFPTLDKLEANRQKNVQTNNIFQMTGPTGWPLLWWLISDTFRTFMSLWDSMTNKVKESTIFP